MDLEHRCIPDVPEAELAKPHCYDLAYTKLRVQRHPLTCGRASCDGPRVGPETRPIMWFDARNDVAPASAGKKNRREAAAFRRQYGVSVDKAHNEARTWSANERPSVKRLQCLQRGFLMRVTPKAHTHAAKKHFTSPWITCGVQLLRLRASRYSLLVGSEQ
jgi:hypothetical protein